MFLFLTIALVSLLLTITPDIVKVLRISKLLALRKNTATPAQQQQLSAARAELERLLASPATSGEYAQYIKTMRAQKKIKDLEQEISGGNQNFERLMKSYYGELIITYGLKAVLSLILVAISITNRYTPVMVFDYRFNFAPLEGLLSFPTGVPNAISVPVWVVSCNTTFRLAYSLIKAKK